jgi:hypothetical protein
VREPSVRVAAAGAEPRTLSPGDPVAAALVAAAGALLSAAQAGSEG